MECCISKKKSILHISDIQTLYPNQGVSDAVIDFFVRSVICCKASLVTFSLLTTLCIHRILLPKKLKAMEFIAGALTYTAVASVCTSDVLERKRKFLNTNGAMNTSHPLLLFPCRTM